jgi:hypothetical protein
MVCPFVFLQSAKGLYTLASGNLADIAAKTLNTTNFKELTDYWGNRSLA